MQFIKILVEFDLYISTIRFKESSIQHTQCTSVMFIFRSLSPKTDVHTGLQRNCNVCALSLHAVILPAYRCGTVLRNLVVVGSPSP